MFQKIAKITFGSGKKYFIFVFLSVFLSLFSYIFGNNIILWVQNYLMEQVKPLLWADVVVSPRDGLWEKELFQKYENTFEIAQIYEINTTLFDTNQNPKLYEAVFHTENYPFYNSFEFEVINPEWKLIVDQNTLDTFGKNIEVFGKKYDVRAVITKTPLWELSLYASENKIYLPIEEFPSDLNQTNSRLDSDFFLKFRGEYDTQAVKILKDDVQFENYRIRSLEDRNENIAEITDRFYVFINFFHLIVFVLTFFIVILSLESYFKKIKPTLGLLNIFWLKKNKIFVYNFVLLWIVFLLWYVAAVWGNMLIFSYISTQYAFLETFAISNILGFWVMIILLIVGIFSPFYKIKKSSTQALLFESSAFHRFEVKELLLYVALVFGGFFAIQILSNIAPLQALLVSFWAFVWMAIFYLLLQKILLWNYEKFFKKVKNFYIFDAIRSTIKPGNVSFFILFSSIISFLSVFVFLVFSGSFVNYLNTLTQESRDMFLINVQQKDISEFEKYFTQDEIYEIVTLRIAKINDIPLKEFLWVESVPREFGREFFSTTSALQNPILKWKKLSQWWVSVDEEFSKRLGLKIGDSIEYTVAWLPIILEVQNIRASERSGTNPFFFFQLTKEDFEKYPKTYIVSYKQSDKEKWLEQKLNRFVWGTLTVINTKDIIEIVSGIAEQILKIVYVCFSYIFLFSFLSFAVCLTFLQSFKEYKLKLLHILGWQKKKLLQALRFEYFYLLLLWSISSLIAGTIILLWIFSFIDYFPLHSISYIFWILLVFGWVWMMSLYLFLIKGK